MLMVVTTKVKDHCNKVGRVSPMSRCKRVVISFSVCSTCLTKFRRIVFMVGERGTRSFRGIVKGHVRGVVGMECTFRRLRGLPRKFRIPTKEMGP